MVVLVRERVDVSVIGGPKRRVTVFDVLVSGVLIRSFETRSEAERFARSFK